MADGRITLTDVMLGIDKHGLVDKLSDQCFKFLVGLILEANRIGFKNPFDLTVNQALAAGGGSSRQTLSSRRRSLARFKIDGKQLVEIKVGNHARNTTATYQIDYKLLCSQNGAWKGLEVQPSNIIDSSLSAEVRQADGSLDGSLTILRSDQKRSEEKREEQNNPEQFSPSAGDSESKLSEVDQFIKLLKDKFKLPSDPVYGMVNNMVYKYGIESCVAAMESSKPTSNTWSGILAYISKVAANISAQSRGVSGEKLDKIERAYRELYDEVTEYREYFDANQDKLNVKERKESARWLDWNESQLAMMRHTIEENGGSLEVRR